MSSFASLNELSKYIKSKTKEVIENEVFEEVRDTMKEHIQTDVYNKYNPTQYKRRRANGGLLDNENINKNTTDNDDNIEMVVTNDTTGAVMDGGGGYLDTGGRIDYIIERGEGYTWERSLIYKMQPYPRPFIRNTKEDLEMNKNHVKALKKGLFSRGIKTK